MPSPQIVVGTPGGVTFEEAAPSLARVVDNGVCVDDERVMLRTNEATKIVLDHLIPVGGMMSIVTTGLTVPGVADGQAIVLPPEMENAIEVVAPAGTQVRGDTDLAQGWYDITKHATYVDPDLAHDLPMIDLGLQPDATDPSVLRRTYFFEGLQPNASVLVTGVKRYRPITQDTDYLIVQNVEALKMIILSIERYENNAPDDAAKYRQQGLEMLSSEVKKHLLDPQNVLRRKSAYFDDLATFATDTFGWMRASLALEMPGILSKGKSELGWQLQMAEKRLMQRGYVKDSIETIVAQVVDGIVYFPKNVQAVLAIDLAGHPIPIRSEFFEYQENGPGQNAVYNMLIDQGDEYLPGTQSVRRKYKLIASTDSQEITAVCKLRWLEKQPGDRMVVKNFEALRLMVSAINDEEAKDFQKAQAAQQQAYDLVEKELREYLGGLKHVPHVETYGFSVGERCLM